MPARIRPDRERSPSRTRRHPDTSCLGRPRHPWAFFIYGEKGVLKASTTKWDFIPLDKDAKPIHRSREAATAGEIGDSSRIMNLQRPPSRPSASEAEGVLRGRRRRGPGIDRGSAGLLRRPFSKKVREGRSRMRLPMRSVGRSRRKWPKRRDGSLQDPGPGTWMPSITTCKVVLKRYPSIANHQQKSDWRSTP